MQRPSACGFPLCRSRDALAAVGLARYDVDSLCAPLIGSLPFRFTSMLEVCCLLTLLPVLSLFPLSLLVHGCCNHDLVLRA